VARGLDETVWAVNPKNDSAGHLATYLCHFAKEFLEPTAIRCWLDVAPDLPEVTLTAEVRHNVLLVIKEALNNAVKHSGATELWLRLRVNDGVMIIEVSDNGRGFAVEAKREAGNGLRNMAERMGDIGGQLVVRSTAAEGAAVCLWLPLPANDSGRSSRQARPI
jgi:signal transduction histidine kinase